MTISPLPFESIENDYLRVDYLTTTGPRIIGLYAKGVEGNLLAETPDIHWPTPLHEHPDMGCNVEAYVRDICLEIETLGPLTTLKPNESMNLEETWELTAGEYPATLESIRKISKQLSRN